MKHNWIFLLLVQFEMSAVKFKASSAENLDTFQGKSFSLDDVATFAVEMTYKLKQSCLTLIANRRSLGDLDFFQMLTVLSYEVR